MARVDPSTPLQRRVRRPCGVRRDGHLALLLLDQGADALAILTNPIFAAFHHREDV